jgi:hypothetical protein
MKDTRLARVEQSSSLISSDRVHELALNITAAAPDLQAVTNNTGLTILAQDLAQGQLEARRNLATALMRKDDFSARDKSAHQNRLDADELATALTTLVSTDIIRNDKGQEVGYNPESDDISILAAVSGAIVKSAIKQEDVKVELEQSLIALIEHAGDHALGMFVSQVNTLVLSDDQTHKTLGIQMLKLATNKFFPFQTQAEIQAQAQRDAELFTNGVYTSRDIEAATSEATVVARKLKAVAKMTLNALNTALKANSGSTIGGFIRDNVLTNAILTSSSMTRKEKLVMIKFVCKSIGKKVDFAVVEELQVSLIPESQAKSVSKSVVKEASNLIEDANASQPQVVIVPASASNIDEDDEL